MRQIEFIRTIGVVAILAATLSATQSANAFTLRTFTDRDAWESAVKSEINIEIKEEDFESFTDQDLSFNDVDQPNGVEQPRGDFTLKGTGSRQKIDVSNPDLDVPTFSVNGTTMILGQTDSDSSFEITFDSPITAFGVDLDDISTLGRTQLIAFGEDFDDEKKLSPDLAQLILNQEIAQLILNQSTVAQLIDGSDYVDGRILNTDDSFFGFIADGNVSTIGFNSVNGGFDGFGMDNFAYVSSPVNFSPSRSNVFFPDNPNPLPFVPVEFSPSESIPIVFNATANVPFNFSPALGLLGFGGMWIVSHLCRRFGSK